MMLLLSLAAVAHLCIGGMILTEHSEPIERTLRKITITGKILFPTTYILLLMVYFIGGFFKRFPLRRD